MLKNLLTETAEVATKVATKNGFMKFVDKIYAWGNWVKPAMLIMGGTLIIGIVAQVIVAIVKGK